MYTYTLVLTPNRCIALKRHSIKCRCPDHPHGELGLPDSEFAGGVTESRRASFSATAPARARRRCRCDRWHLDDQGSISGKGRRDSVREGPRAVRGRPVVSCGDGGRGTLESNLAVAVVTSLTPPSRRVDATLARCGGGAAADDENAILPHYSPCVSRQTSPSSAFTQRKR